MRRILSVCLVVFIALTFAACTGKGEKGAMKEEAELKLSKASYKPGEIVMVTYSTPAGYAEDAWIGIIPSEIGHGSEAVNDQHDVTYKYLNKSTAGEMVFNAPTRPGKYDFRLNDTDNNGKEVTYVTFLVVGETKPETSEVGTGREFKDGDSVMVEWKGKWWPAKIIEVRKDCWYIRYDGYGDSWNECVGPKRIKKK